MSPTSNSSRRESAGVTSMSPSAQNQPGLITAKTFILSPNNKMKQNKRMIVKKKPNSVKTAPTSHTNINRDRQPVKAISVEAKEKPTMLILQNT